MAAMQRIQPKVKALQNQYKGKNDPEAKKEMQAKLMELYKEHNVNPFASCLPLVFQMPVFIGLYQVLRSYHPTTDTAFLGIPDIFVPLHQIGAMRGVHASTVMRRLRDLRAGLQRDVRSRLRNRLGLAAPELDSLERVVADGLDLSLSELFGERSRPAQEQP